MFLYESRKKVTVLTVFFYFYYIDKGEVILFSRIRLIDFVSKNPCVAYGRKFSVINEY